jgi:hypothetical protein
MSLSVVCWKWGTLFGPEYVNRLRRGLARHLRLPHTFHCITDNAAGVETGGRSGDVVVHHMYTNHAAMKAGNRSCFRRLRMFSKDMGETLGPRILHLDLDTVVVGDVTPLFDRADPLVLLKQSDNGKGRVTHNPSVLLMDAGVLHAMWERFNAFPDKTWREARARGWACSDMSVINDYIHVNRATVKAATWGEADGVQAYWRRENKQLRPGARLVTFYGKENPGDAAVQAKSPWIAEHWQ